MKRLMNKPTQTRCFRFTEGKPKISGMLNIWQLSSMARPGLKISTPSGPGLYFLCLVAGMPGMSVMALEFGTLVDQETCLSGTFVSRGNY